MKVSVLASMVLEKLLAEMEVDFDSDFASLSRS
jgi:hypothetical protein